VKYDIIINVNHLKNGTYHLKIIQNNKIIEKNHFKK